MTLRQGDHHFRLSLKLWDFFAKRKKRGYGSVQSQVNSILTSVKEKGEREERKQNK